MNGINYTDLHKVYHPHLCQSQPVEVVLEEEVYEKPIKKKRIRKDELLEMCDRIDEVEDDEELAPILETRFNDPLRQLASDFLPIAAAYAITGWLGAYSKGPNYVGNQHISSMSDERVAEYRRLGLLPPPA